MTKHLDSIRGCISVFRRQGIGTVLEALFFTAENMIVLKTGEGGELQGALGPFFAWRKTRSKEEQFAKLSAEELMKAEEVALVIPYSEVGSVELRKYGLGAKIKLSTETGSHEWIFRGIPGKKGAKTEDAEVLLRLVFPSKLSSPRKPQD